MPRKKETDEDVESDESNESGDADQYEDSEDDLADDASSDPEDAKHNEHVQAELNATSNFLKQNTGSSHSLPGILSGQNSWNVASEIVATFRPVPPLMWSIINAVFGRQIEQKGAGKKTSSRKKIHPMMFFAGAPLIMRASADATLRADSDLSQENTNISLTLAVEILGPDVCAAACLIHSVCRRITKRIPERMWKPILDDALLRAQIGYYVGNQSRLFGTGRGMLVGFAGRAGLAIQIASGGTLQAQHTLTALATGSEMKEVGMSFYGCDPLQVSAMMLVAAGCHRDAAYGTASFSSRKMQPPAESEQFRWLSAFSIIENVRIGKSAHVSDDYWYALDFDEDEQENLKNQVKVLQRRGHTWGWMTQAHILKEGT